MAIQSQPRHVRVSCKVVELAEVPSEILICPAGAVHSDNARFVMDRVAAELCIQRFRLRRVDVPIDWEHETESTLSAKRPHRAPAAGWIKSLFWRQAEGLFAKVEWTEQGAADIESKQYRYLSPVIFMRHTDRRAIAIVSVGLTNNPAIRGIRAIANSFRKGMATMDLKQKLIEILGLDGAADEQAILDVVGALMASGKGGETTANSMRSIDGDDELKRVLNRATVAESELSKVRCREFIREGMDSGKITQHKVSWWESFFARDPAGAADFIKEAPVIAPLPGRVVQNSQALPGGSYSGKRGTIISNAQFYYRAHSEELARITDERSYISGQLVENRMQRLSDEEAAKLGL